jgi:hypothetical protein
VNGLKWVDVNVSDYTFVSTKVLPTIEFGGTSYSGLESCLEFISEQILSHKLSFIEKETINLIDLKLNTKLVRFF